MGWEKKRLYSGKGWKRDAFSDFEEKEHSWRCGRERDRVAQGEEKENSELTQNGNGGGVEPGKGDLGSGAE